MEEQEQQPVDPESVRIQAITDDPSTRVTAIVGFVEIVKGNGERVLKHIKSPTVNDQQAFSLLTEGGMALAQAAQEQAMVMAALQEAAAAAEQGAHPEPKVARPSKAKATKKAAPTKRTASRE